VASGAKFCGWPGRGAVSLGAVDILAGDVRLSAYLARPAEGASHPGQLLVLCHGFPSGPLGAPATGQTYPQLAARVASEAGWSVLCFNFRGTGGSEGDFSLFGWLADLHAVIGHALASEGVEAVWLAGFSTGGSLAICAAGEDERVRGVAAFAAPASFEPWAKDASGFLERARQLGVVKDPAFPPDFGAWARQLGELRPLSLVGKVPPRPLLLVHGTEDEVVDPADARALAAEAGEGAELRMLAGAGHRLRHDPRALAVLVGWLERQRP
jgi:pimeloyl-ACP methyl ester carboxylesterase